VLADSNIPEKCLLLVLVTGNGKICGKLWKIICYTYKGKGYL
jgi:hypothetical protein